MPDKEELEEITESFLDEQDTLRRHARTMPWNRYMEPTPETDEADWTEDTNVNRCVCCGEIIPEGIQVCKNCERAVIDGRERRMAK